ncbi:hypothetical protein JYU34_009392 [Plutella xylostella]|uniref:Uncharacterized protein n=1 Tax=Plutella xylostella TaxID=51655 RepID=A0ABQ7QJT5_PLUXY|nr:hypothetical protein JYU34_009392 [Plutella xylostella]
MGLQRAAAARRRRLGALLLGGPGYTLDSVWAGLYPGLLLMLQVAGSSLLYFLIGSGVFLGSYCSVAMKCVVLVIRLEGEKSSQRHA